MRIYVCYQLDTGVSKTVAFTQKEAEQQRQAIERLYKPKKVWMEYAEERRTATVKHE